MKVRIKAILAFMSFVMIGAASFYWALLSLISYFYFPETIIYSWLDCLALTFPFVLFLISASPGYVIIHGNLMPESKLKKIYKSMMFFALISFISPAIFSFVYTSKLEDKGYFRCKGVPIGYMPGMATKYVSNNTLCSEN